MLPEISLCLTKHIDLDVMLNLVLSESKFELLLTRSRYRNNKPAVLLGDKVCARPGCATVGEVYVDLDHEFFSRFQIQANSAARQIHWLRRFLRLPWRKIDELDAGYFFPFF